MINDPELLSLPYPVFSLTEAEADALVSAANCLPETTGFLCNAAHTAYNGGQISPIIYLQLLEKIQRSIARKTIHGKPILTKFRTLGDYMERVVGEAKWKEVFEESELKKLIRMTLRKIWINKLLTFNGKPTIDWEAV